MTIKRAVLSELEVLIDNLEVNDSTELKFQDSQYIIDFEPYEGVGFSYKCPRLGPKFFQVFVDESLENQKRRVVIFHEILELYLYYSMKCPLEEAHNIASKHHNKYARQRNITAPPQ